MLTEEVLRIRQNWAIKGNPSCSHPILDKELFWGKDTGNYICMVCGRSFTHDEWEQEIKRKENQINFLLPLVLLGPKGQS